MVNGSAWPNRLRPNNNNNKEWKKKVRELVEDSRRRVDEEFGRKPSENFSGNKELFWKEMKRVRGGDRDGVLGGGERMESLSGVRAS